MDKEFFEPLIGKQVSVDYNQGSKHSFIEGEVLKVTDIYVSIGNEDCMICVKYASITSIRIMTNEGKH